MEATIEQAVQCSPEEFCQLLQQDPSLLQCLCHCLATHPGALKFQVEKQIRQASEREPALIYPAFLSLAELLHSPNRFIQLGVALTLPNLLALDASSQRYWPHIRQQYLALLDSPHVPVFCNAVKGIEKILPAYPEEEQTLLPLLFQVERHTFLHKGQPSPMCTQVAKQASLSLFLQIYPTSSFREEMATFAQEAQESPRPSLVRLSRKLQKALAGKEHKKRA